MPPNVQVLRGGAPVPSKILVNVDNETVFGDGSIENPLRAPGAGGTPTVQNLSVQLAGGALNPAADVAFVTFDSGGGGGPATVNLTLADGTVDGQQITISAAAADAIEWNIVPASFVSGTDVAIAAGQSGRVTLVWNDTLGGWQLAATYNATLE